MTKCPSNKWGVVHQEPASALLSDRMEKDRRMFTRGFPCQERQERPVLINKGKNKEN